MPNFSNGTSFDIWEEQNCSNCKKNPEKCECSVILNKSFWEDDLTENEADQLGYDSCSCYFIRCKHFVYRNCIKPIELFVNLPVKPILCRKYEYNYECIHCDAEFIGKQELDVTYKDGTGFCNVCIDKFAEGYHKEEMEYRRLSKN